MKNDVDGNKFFSRARARAGKLFQNNQRLKQLMANAREKLDTVNIGDIDSAKFTERIKVLVRMVKAYKRGTYRDIQLQNILLMVAGLVYFVTPIDLVPDFIPITGLVDDFTVILWVYSKMQQEIDKFIAWEKGLEQG